MLRKEHPQYPNKNAQYKFTGVNLYRQTYHLTPVTVLTRDLKVTSWSSTPSSTFAIFKTIPRDKLVLQPGLELVARPRARWSHGNGYKMAVTNAGCFWSSVQSCKLSDFRSEYGLIDVNVWRKMFCWFLKAHWSVFYLNGHVYTKGANAKSRWGHRSDFEVVWRQETSDWTSSHQGKEQAIRSHDRGTGR